MVNKNTSKPVVPLKDLPDSEYDKKWPQEKNFKFVRKSNDPRFGEVSIVKNHSNKEVLLVKEKMASSKKEASNDIRNLKSRMRLNHRNMLQMVDYSTAVKKNLCSTTYLSRAFYRYPPTDMRRELQEHKKSLTNFSSQDLSNTYSDMSGALNHLHSKNLTHDDIRPLYVGHDKNQNNHMLLDRFKDATPLERAQTNNLINKKDLFMSPQLYRKLKGKVKDQKYDKKKNDAFALGMTLLQLGTQDSVQDCYRPNGTFDWDRLNTHQRDFDQKYGNDGRLV